MPTITERGYGPPRGEARPVAARTSPPCRGGSHAARNNVCAKLAETNHCDAKNARTKSCQAKVCGTQHYPEGYRLPTNTEFQNLINSSTVSRGGGWSSSDYGYIKFTSGSNSVEFPAVGYRDYDSYGTLYYAGTNGGYWSSVASGSNLAYELNFGSSYLNVGGTYKQLGQSVRCVR
ncbi:MAG: fibrobacter succinogenes major paralogous domain-containing protein [Rikenellaceae bacterium]|nr:fibrobacter succinogenes major paralogous domain-containing protein [Rikenellaceae bacterium]